MTRELQIKIKYTLDRVLAIFLLIFMAPLFMIIAILIKIEDGGPIFFKQKRPGLWGKAFMIWKFRSMIPDADHFLDEKGSPTIENRVTRVGKILRSLSLDEMPQLINVVRGEMSFIGPRPALWEHMERYTDEQKKRFAVRPGLTGLALVKGRNTLKWSRRIEYDLEYIKNYSLKLDLTILTRTIKTVILLREGIVLDRNPEQVDDIGRQ